jgi:ribosomal protein S18
MRNFAFKIDRNTQGHYVVTELATTQEQIAVIRRKMEINQNFLRTMIILGDSKFNLSDEYIKKLSHSTTKRGRILFSKNFNRRVKGNIANHIKRMRYMGVLPYVNYYA